MNEYNKTKQINKKNERQKKIKTINVHRKNIYHTK